MNTDLKIHKSDLIFYDLADNISIKILKYSSGKKLLRYVNGTCPVNKADEIFKVLISKSILYAIISIISASLFLIFFGLSLINSIVSILFVVGISSLPFSKIKNIYKENEKELYIGIENLVQELSILVSAGMSPETAIRIPRQHRDTYRVMLIMFEHISSSDKKGLNISSAILEFSKIYHNKYLIKLNVLLTQSRKKGTGKQVESLVTLAKEMIDERKSTTRKKAETLSTKLLMPLMVSMIGIIAMIMIPVFMQMGM